MKKVGIIGYGETGILHIDAIKEFNNIELLGIVGRNPLRLEQIAIEKNTNYFFDLKTFYETSSPDYLIICLPILEMKSILEKALKYPWTILVEKPLGYNYKENTRILDQIKVNKSIVYVGMNRRMLNSVLSLNQHLETNYEPRRIEIVDQQDTEAASKFGFPKQVIKNWHHANGIHMLDLGLNFTRGNLIEFREYPVKNKVSNEFRFLLKFDSGDILDYFSIWNKKRQWSAEVYVGQHIYELRPIEKLNLLCECCKNKYREFKSYVEPNNIKPGFYNQISAFLGIRVDLMGYLCSPEQANFTSSILNQIYGS